MSLFVGVRKLPAAADGPPLEPDERVLAWAASPTSEQVVVATNRGLWLPGRRPAGLARDPQGGLVGRELRITPAEVARSATATRCWSTGRSVSFLLLEPGEVPEQVRDPGDPVGGVHVAPPAAGGGGRAGGRPPGQRGRTA